MQIFYGATPLTHTRNGMIKSDTYLFPSIEEMFDESYGLKVYISKCIPEWFLENLKFFLSVPLHSCSINICCVSTM